ncbi:DUF4270 domain-containing protein [Costertonia aggregata]|uniref:DUF4270 domain-containing protein n=1 Tax=Costertonia aggregata TaxID=343403 RepID=A0A7H9AQ73_9FLAO|nr:DUF4270 domain-containing protein [Costertonia aggregata]QLG45590.1 DUF4270 domain-containing protein [Costertonia aggregata]
MIFFKRTIFPAMVGLLLIVAFVSCEEEMTTIGEGVIAGEPFTTDVAVFDVFAFNKNITAVQTNRLPLYQLGKFNDPVYGNTTASITSQLRLSTPNPLFGTLRQDVEDNPDTSKPAEIDENETVKEVFLYIPYQTNTGDRDRDGVPDALDNEPDNPNNDSDGDGVSNIQEDRNNTDPLNEDTDGDGILDGVDDSTLGDRFAATFDLDSIYGKGVGEEFNLKVEESTFFLRDLDPSTNFQESQEYFSTQEFSPTFTGEVFFDGAVTIDDKEILFVVEEDDPETDVDEAGTISSKLSPGIRVPLPAAFFQENILDKEGSAELFTNANFSEFFRGIHLSVDSDVLLLLNLTAANITITYEHDSYDSDEETTVKLEKEFVINFLAGGGNQAITGNAVNTLINEAYPTDIQEELDNENNASKIYLKGGAGSFAEIKLFDENNERETIDQIRANNWIINEANLVFYVDRETLDDAGGVIEPLRLYLYNTETNAPLYNAFAEPQVTISTPLTVFPFYDGVLNKNSEDNGITYKIRITDYVNNLILRESDNPTLGLSITSNIGITNLSSAMIQGDAEESAVPTMSAISPLGTVLFGSTPENGEQRLKLEIFYTQTD